MEFFNKKEEVLEIKLTPFGRYKLSRGRFKPTHYAFFDEGILYNSVLSGEGVITTTDPQGGFVEKQNTIEARIQENTPSIKPFNVSTGIQTAQSENAAFIRSIFQTSGSDLLDDPLFMDPGAIYNKEELQYASDTAAFMSRPLGKSRLNSDKYPAWSAAMLQGEISSSTMTASAWMPSTPPDSDAATYHPWANGVEKIPQVSIQVKYNTYVQDAPGVANITNPATAVGVSMISEQIESIFTTPTATNNVQSVTTELIGDKYIVVERNDLVIELTEYNTAFQKENFDIEVFLSGSQYPGSLKQLKFNNDASAIYNSEDVQFFINLRVDNEIERSLMERVGISDPTTLGQATGAGTVSTRDYFIKDIYKPEEDLCD